MNGWPEDPVSTKSGEDSARATAALDQLPRCARR
jgi:hypothetical protein